jgi:hypothetical protein
MVVSYLIAYNTLAAGVQTFQNLLISSGTMEDASGVDWIVGSGKVGSTGRSLIKHSPK